MKLTTKAGINKLAKEYSGLDYATAQEKFKKRIGLILSFVSINDLKILEQANIDFVSDAAKVALKARNVEVAFAELAEKTMIEPSTPDTFLEEEIAPSAVILAQVVEKNRDGNETTTYELASLVNRLAYSELSSEQIAQRFSAAFGDVLIRKD